jgi:hypothetical protein
VACNKSTVVVVAEGWDGFGKAGVDSATVSSVLRPDVIKLHASVMVKGTIKTNLKARRILNTSLPFFRDEFRFAP